MKSDISVKILKKTAKTTICNPSDGKTLLCVPLLKNFIEFVLKTVQVLTCTFWETDGWIKILRKIT